MDTDVKLYDEPGRLRALVRYNVLDTPAEPAFEKITSLVQTVLGVPIAAVSLVDADRQWFKSVKGLGVCETARDISFCTHAIQRYEPLIVSDARRDSRFHDNPLVTGPPHIMSYAGVPLQSPDGYNLGSLCAIDTVPRSYTPAQIDLLKSFAAVVMSELELRMIAARDSLTGAMTRRAFIAECEKAMALYERHGTEQVLIVLDVDHFKAVNDTYGHGVGDSFLKQVVHVCHGLSRAEDSLGRLGGEEFALLVTATDASTGLATADRVRTTIAAIRHASCGSITVSCGVAPLRRGGTVEAWLDRADQALYAAKNGGRNQCVLAEV